MPDGEIQYDLSSLMYVIALYTILSAVFLNSDLRDKSTTFCNVAVFLNNDLPNNVHGRYNYPMIKV